MPPAFLADLFRAIVRFHDKTIRVHGGLLGFRDQGLLHFVVERPWMTAFGDEIFKTTFEKAAAIAEAIVRHHPFNDGNHRTGLAAAELILEMADMRLVALQKEKLDSIRRLESGALGLDEFAAWLAQNSILKTGLPN